MTLREEYQAKVDLANRLLKKKKYTTRESIKTREEIENLKEIYEYRIEAIDRRQKAREKEDKKDQVNNYEEMLKDMENDKKIR